MSPTQNNSPNTQTSGSDSPDAASVDTPSPPPSPSSTSPSSACQGLKLFHWSGSSALAERSRKPENTSGLAALQLFKYKKETSSSSSKTHRSPENTSPLCKPFTDGNTDYTADLPDSPPSQDSAYFSQSQPSLTSCHKEEVPAYSFPPSYHEDAASVCSYKSPPPLEMSLHTLWLGPPSHIHIITVSWFRGGRSESYFGSMVLCSYMLSFMCFFRK